MGPHLSDNVVLVQFLRGESQIKRALTVLKLGKRFADDQSLA